MGALDRGTVGPCSQGKTEELKPRLAVNTSKARRPEV